MDVLNPRIDRLAPYPMQRLSALIAGVSPPAGLAPILLSVGEPRHPLPRIVSDALAAASTAVDRYPAFWAGPELRAAIADWLAMRFAPARLDPAAEILPVNGAREGLFSFFQAVADPTRAGSRVICPNPGYAVYDGVASLCGLEPYRLATGPDDRDGQAYDRVPREVWRQTQLVFVCSPDNPRGTTLSQKGWERLFALADEYGFVIVADECYCEIYVDDAERPVGSLEAAARCGRGHERLAAFFSLSKRSNAPGLRSGFIAGDAKLLARVEKFRSYNGGGMNPAVQAASIAAWRDEAHVVENRRLYREKYDAVIPRLQRTLKLERPQAGFFLWADIRETGLSDEAFTRALYAERNVVVLPGSYLTHSSEGHDPGAGHVRIALVASLEECLEGADRIASFCFSQASRRRVEA